MAKSDPMARARKSWRELREMDRGQRDQANRSQVVSRYQKALRATEKGSR